MEEKEKKGGEDIIACIVATSAVRGMLDSMERGDKRAGYNLAVCIHAWLAGYIKVKKNVLEIPGPSECEVFAKK